MFGAGLIQRFVTQVTRFHRAVAILTLNAVVIFVCLDLAAAGLLRAESMLTGSEVLDSRFHSPYYRDKPWATQYWREFKLSRKERYEAFTVWRRGAFKGETINLDAHGIRVTPGSECVPGALKIFTFGSSHMWGTGSPDWGTIPAYLLKEFRAVHAGPICVSNFAESGYVSMQSVTELILQLDSGNVPDIAVFMDGQADIYAGYQSGRASRVHENFDVVAARVEGQDRPSQPPLVQFLHSSSLFDVVNRIQARVNGVSDETRLSTYATKGIACEPLAQAIASNVLANYDVVSALARAYKFDSYFFWPPYIARGHKPLTPEEKLIIARDVDSAFIRLDRSVEHVVAERPRESDAVVSLSQVFDDMQSLVWIDDAHSSPVGNQMIARKMMQAIRGDRQ